MQEKKENFIQKILKKKRLLIIVVVVAVLGILLWRFISAKKNLPSETAKVERGTVENELILSGNVAADEYAKLSFPTSGEIVWVGVKEGDLVKKGQALTKLDTTVLNSAFQQSRSTLRAAEATVENIHDQVKDHSGDETFVQKDERTTAEVNKDKAYEAFIIADYNLRNSTLTSPFSGTVTYLAHSFSGENILFSEEQVEVINPATIYFDVTADQSDVINLEVDQQVNIVLDSMQNDPLKGQIDFIGYTPKIGETGTVYKVRVKFEGNSLDYKKYRIGMSGDAKVILSSRENVLFLPPKYVKADANGKYVHLNSKNGKTYVKIGIESEDKIEILEGVTEGQLIYN